MKITDVEPIVLESPYENTTPEGSEEATGVKHCLLLKVSTDEGITGWADIETAPHIGRAAVLAPASGIEAFDGLRSIVIGQEPESRPVRRQRGDGGILMTQPRLSRDLPVSGAKSLIG